jgi:hypothetical protein
MNFDLGLGSEAQTGDCTVTASWTDANGKAQTVTGFPLTFATVVSTSLPAKGTILWSSSSGNNLQFHWQLEQAPAASVGGYLLSPSQVVYTNLTGAPINLNLRSRAQADWDL